MSIASVSLKPQSESIPLTEMYSAVHFARNCKRNNMTNEFKVTLYVFLTDKMKVLITVYNKSSNS